MMRRNNKKNRILWLLNHTTLMEWEVPMLIDLGFEVFVPKHLPTGGNSRTATVTDFYDSTLTTPTDDLHQLNNINFYDEPFTKKTASLLNDHFETVISAFHFPGLYYLLRAFNGKIFMRAFGHAGALDYESATKHIPSNSLNVNSFSTTFARIGRLHANILSRLPGSNRIRYHNKVMHEMVRARKRIYLASGYEEIISHERKFLKARSVFLPLAVPQVMFDKANCWNGCDNRVLFICPNIDQIEYYKHIYLTFKKHLGDMPHCIAGKQSLSGVKIPATTRDPAILGYVPQETLDRLFRDCFCMFYHSQEPRHLHYHPIEAIVAGQPLIYLSGGLLESLGGIDQPGMCKNYAEAREKIKCLQQGDITLRDSIKSSQKKILGHFEPAYCSDVWKTNFLPLVRDKTR